MKKCSVCTKPSLHHVTVIQDDGYTELHFCDGHFEEYMSGTKGDSGSNADALAYEGEVEADTETEATTLSCPNCGISYQEFRQKGRFGCPHDYEVFRPRLLALLDNIHNDTEHHGKIPEHAATSSAHQREVIELRRALAAAIEAEKYEEAVQLRDRIQRLESRLPDPSA